MKHRVIRLALLGGLTLAASTPFTAPANAFVCPDVADVVCQTYGLACQFVPEGGKVNPHTLLCESFA